jgi:hypothetical protein
MLRNLQAGGKPDTGLILWLSQEYPAHSPSGFSPEWEKQWYMMYELMLERTRRRIEGCTKQKYDVVRGTNCCYTLGDHRRIAARIHIRRDQGRSMIANPSSRPLGRSDRRQDTQPPSNVTAAGPARVAPPESSGHVQQIGGCVMAVSEVRGPFRLRRMCTSMPSCAVWPGISFVSHVVRALCSATQFIHVLGG